jgi:hypothetical protein
VTSIVRARTRHQPFLVNCAIATIIAITANIAIIATTATIANTEHR